MSTDTNITSVLKEHRVFPPSAEFAAKAHVPAAERDRLLALDPTSYTGLAADLARRI